MRYRIFSLPLALILCLAAGGISGHHHVLHAGQQKMESASDWNMLANDVANRINTELIRQNYLNTSVHVRHHCGKAGPCGSHDSFPFDVAFNELLTTQLVSFGIKTVNAPEGAGLLVDYKVQTVYHPPDRSGVGTNQENGCYELIVSISIVDNKQYVMRFSEVYSMNKADFWQYRQAEPAVEIPLSGATGDASSPVTTE
jgi:hypothetical protein